VLQDLAILPENVYNMDETGVMLGMLGSSSTQREYSKIHRGPPLNLPFQKLILVRKMKYRKRL